MTEERPRPPLEYRWPWFYAFGLPLPPGPPKARRARGSAEAVRTLCGVDAPLEHTPCRGVANTRPESGRPPPRGNFDTSAPYANSSSDQTRHCPRRGARRSTRSTCCYYRRGGQRTLASSVPIRSLYQTRSRSRSASPVIAQLHTRGKPSRTSRPASSLKLQNEGREPQSWRNARPTARRPRTDTSRPNAGTNHHRATGSEPDPVYVPGTEDNEPTN